MKKITLIGNITRDAEIRDVSNKKAIGFTVAVNENYKDSNGVKVEKSSFFNCTIWRENVNIAQYLKKGVKVYIESDNLDAEHYQSKDGGTKSSIKINVSKLELLSPSQNAQNGYGYGNNYNNTNNTNNTISSTTFSDDDLPF